jgi:hypothetical protein
VLYNAAILSHTKQVNVGGGGLITVRVEWWVRNRRVVMCVQTYDNDSKMMV